MPQSWECLSLWYNPFVENGDGAEPEAPKAIKVDIGLPGFEVTITPLETPAKKPFRVPEAIALKLGRYVLFGTLAALLPFLFDAISTHAKTGAITSFDLFRKGELFLVTAGVGFAAVGELLGNKRQRHQILKLYVGGLCALSAVADAGLYGWAHNQLDPFNGKDATQLSLVLFWITFLLGGVCLVLSEID